MAGKKDKYVKSIKKAYKKIAHSYKRKVKSADLDHRFIERFLAVLKPRKMILDLGTGTGNIANELSVKHQLKVTAVDISPEMIKIAKKNHPNLNIKLMDLRNLKFKSKFDAVFANYSLIHILETDIPKTIKGIYKVLKPKGYFYLALQEPKNKNQKDGYYPVVYNPRIKLFINLFRERKMKSYLKKAGFKILWTDRRNPDKKTEFPFNKRFITAQKK